MFNLGLHALSRNNVIGDKDIIINRYHHPNSQGRTTAVHNPRIGNKYALMYTVVD